MYAAAVPPFYRGTRITSNDTVVYGMHKTLYEAGAGSSPVCAKKSYATISSVSF